MRKQKGKDMINEERSESIRNRSTSWKGKSVRAYTNYRKAILLYIKLK